MQDEWYFIPLLMTVLGWFSLFLSALAMFGHIPTLYAVEVYFCTTSLFWLASMIGHSIGGKR